MILSRFGQLLGSYSVQHKNPGKISKPVQVFTILFFSFFSILSASVSTPAAIFTVTKTADTNDGNCDADCSLREAVAAANSAASDDVIEFDSNVFGTTRTITLTGLQLVIVNNGTLNITAPIDHVPIISGNRTSRVFFISSGANATLSNLTIIQGDGDFGNAGGGIYIDNGGILTVNNSIIEDNGPYSNGLTSEGGGIYGGNNSLLNINNSIIQNNAVSIGGAGISTFGTVNITNSQIRNNNANDHGGGIRASGIVNITDSVITGNNVLFGSSGGGGIYSERGFLTFTNSIINNNSVTNMNADGGGGGIYIGSSTTFNLTNLTISNNLAYSGGGGGIYNRSGVGNLTNVTIVNNQANSNVNNQGSGAGILNRFKAPINIRNSIIADNFDPSGIAPDFQGAFLSQGFNLIENISGTIITGNHSGNIIGIDPQLMPLGNYGGTTQTVALKPSSPAIDAGDPNNFPATDQRGIPRPQDGNLDGTLHPDIGAYERQITIYTVLKTADTNDGVCDSDCSLREAIFAANNASTPDNGVVFDASVFSVPQTITLTGGELVLGTNRNLIISGAGADLLTISGNNQSRVLSISPGAAASIMGVTITGGNGVGAALSGFGGAILNDGGNFSAVNSAIKQNATQAFGGGIYSDNNGEIILDYLAVKDNSAVGNGGGIFINSGSGSITETTFSGNSSNSGGGISNLGILSLTRSTVNNNTAVFGGGGIVNTNQLSLINSTISGNSINGTFGGGGIFNDSTGILNVLSSTIAVNTGNNGGGIRNNGEGTINAFNSIIADNIDNSNTAPDLSGLVVSQGYNLIENTTGAVITGTATGNITGVDPQLLPLRDNGGPTPTHAVHLSSPAIDQGRSFGIITDQRGFHRPFGFSSVPDTNDGSDIGAYERQVTDFGGQALFDFDGDGRTDISIFRPNAGEWWYLRSLDGGNLSYRFGASSDKVVAADYTGDGKTDLAIFRPSTSEWFVLRSEDNSFYSFPFGTSTDIPTPSDFDGDGIDDVAIFRPSIATWFIIRSSDGGTTITTFGANGDQPVVADYDGDGFADVAIFRPSDGSWWINRSSAGFTVTTFGIATDKTVQADYTGDGKADIAFWRPSTGEWFVLRSENSSFYTVPFGSSGDIAAPGDYDGDGAADYAVFRSSNATWYVQQSTAGFAAVSFGAAGDQPVPNAFVR